MGANILATLIDALTGFVTGISGAFVSAFQHIFMVESSEGVFSGVSDLGTFLLVMFGVSLGYGVIRWITGLFRRETR